MSAIELPNESWRRTEAVCIAQDGTERRMEVVRVIFNEGCKDEIWWEWTPDEWKRIVEAMNG